MSVQPQQKHYDAFNYWFQLTQKGYTTTEAIEMTAEWVGIKKRRMWVWYKDLEWKQKAEERRKEIQKVLEKKENKTLADNKKKYLDICHKQLYDYVEQGLNADINSMKELTELIKMCLVLQDAPSNVTKNDTEVQMDIDNSQLFDKNLMQKILEEEQELNKD